MYKKLRKTNEQIYTKPIKTLFLAFWAQIGPKKFFIELKHFNSTSLYKKSEKTNEQILQKSPKTPIFGHFWAQIGPNNFFFENRAPSHFGHHHFIPLYQKSINSYEPIPRKAGNGRTDTG